MKVIGALLMVTLLFGSVGCADLTPRQQRILTGGALGAGGGAVLGAITGGSAAVGAVVGAAAGVVGGAIVDQTGWGR